MRALTKLYAYGSKSPMNVIGTVYGTVESKRKITEALIFVVPGDGGSLLSFNTASDLGLIKININSIGSREPITIDTLSKQHPELFNGVGKSDLRNFQVRLHIDKNIKPSAQNHGRVPFHLCKKVEEELKLLLEQYIIERDEEPTP